MASKKSVSRKHRIGPPPAGLDVIRTDTPPDPERIEKAHRAVKRFVAMRPGLEAFARAITGDPEVKLVMHHGKPCTDGKNIYMPPSIELGEKYRHENPRLCGQRDENSVQMCPGCAGDEEALIEVLHETGHITAGSFDPITDKDGVTVISEAVREAGAADGSTRAGKIAARIIAEDPKTYVHAANVVSPFLGLILNAIEDAAVNRLVTDARPGAAAMFRASNYRIFNDGFIGEDGQPFRWSEQKPNIQAAVGIFAKASGFAYKGWFTPEVEQMLNDPKLTSICLKLQTARSVRARYKMGFPILETARQHGFFKTDRDLEDDEPEPEEQDEPEEQPVGENTEERDDQGRESDTESRDQKSQEESQVGDSGENSDGEQGENAESEPAGEDDGAGSPDEDQPASSDDATQDAQSGSQTAPGDSQETESAEADDESDGDADDDSEDESDPSDSGGDADDEPDPFDADENRRGYTATDDDESDDDQTDSDIDPEEDDLDGEPEDDWDDEDPEDDWDDDGYKHLEEQDGTDSHGGPSDTVPSAPSCPEDDDEPAESPAPAPDMGTAEEAEEALNVFGGHAPNGPQDEQDQQAAEADTEEVARAVVQSGWFDGPSRNVLGVREHRMDQHVISPGPGGKPINYDWTEATGYKQAESQHYGSFIEDHAEEAIMAPALKKMRLVFSDNQKSRKERNLKTGKINAKVLGRRAPKDIADPRLFMKKKLPGKRDYFVVIGLDISGSTVGKEIGMIKSAALAQADLCHRLGVEFAVYAHTGTYIGSNYYIDTSGMNLDIFIIKDPKERWDNAARERLLKITPAMCNLDGHTMEYYRKVLDRQQATDKILMYYTDGAMPAENQTEELAVLQREINLCQQRRYALVGVGIGTDSPTKHGLETVRIDDLSEVPRVVDFLEKQMLRVRPTA